MMADQIRAYVTRLTAFAPYMQCFGFSRTKEHTVFDCIWKVVFNHKILFAPSHRSLVLSCSHLDVALVSLKYFRPLRICEDRLSVLLPISFDRANGIVWLDKHTHRFLHKESLQMKFIIN